MDAVPDNFVLPTLNDIDPDTSKAYTKSKIKKIKKKYEILKKKELKSKNLTMKNKEMQLSKNVETEKKLQDAKNIILEEDKNLKKAMKINIKQINKYINQRVKIFGWINVIRKQSKTMFILLRDGSDYNSILQCVLENKLIQTYDALTLNKESSILVYGVLNKDSRAEKGVELRVDYWKLIGKSDGEIMNNEANVNVLMDNRHFAIRDQIPSLILRLRSYIMQIFREYYFSNDFIEITPPTIVQTQVEGGSTLFSLDYYGSPAYLTQSSQLYLETCIYSLGKVFCVAPSYRAEKMRTRRHVSEYTHLEVELPFITFEDLLIHIEDLIFKVCCKIVENYKKLVLSLNPNFKIPKKPFKRMDHKDAIDFCNENNIYKDEELKIKFKYGEDIPEGPERKMINLINEPVFLCRFPSNIKPFYMSKCEENESLTESIDLLLPNVGETVGGSMREFDYGKLMKGFKENGIDSKAYYWYTDLRKSGSIPHGGYGLGFERMLCWILGRDHIRDVILYPRVVNRCSP